MYSIYLQVHCIIWLQKNSQIFYFISNFKTNFWNAHAECNQALLWCHFSVTWKQTSSVCVKKPFGHYSPEFTTESNPMEGMYHFNPQIKTHHQQCIVCYMRWHNPCGRLSHNDRLSRYCTSTESTLQHKLANMVIRFVAKQHCWSTKAFWQD